MVIKRQRCHIRFGQQVLIPEITVQTPTDTRVGPIGAHQNIGFVKTGVSTPNQNPLVTLFNIADSFASDYSVLRDTGEEQLVEGRPVHDSGGIGKKGDRRGEAEENDC
jgi:hypothetical protein